jgi:Amt family ammonium transporter
MMPVLDRWVVDHAIQWWQSKGGRAPALNVNLSVETLVETVFPAYVQRQLRKAAMPGDALYFEVDAVDVMTHAQKARGAADKLKALGCRIAITGFGRDLVSFEALRTASAGMIKVDGGLVMEIHRDPAAFAKIKSIQGVCAKVGIQTVAEFVEQQETIEKLRAIGFNYAQGYGVARPEPLN